MLQAKHVEQRYGTAGQVKGKASRPLYRRGGAHSLAGSVGGNAGTKGERTSDGLTLKASPLPAPPPSVILCTCRKKRHGVRCGDACETCPQTELDAYGLFFGGPTASHGKSTSEGRHCRIMPLMNEPAFFRCDSPLSKMSFLKAYRACMPNSAQDAFVVKANQAYVYNLVQDAVTGITLWSTGIIVVCGQFKVALRHTSPPVRGTPSWQQGQCTDAPHATVGAGI
mmetsp:Transcript_147350/g.257534  ORF Transcript_147350/g.257534 Transcript_147350/m.257534 type:complete len:225 (+) Transcript_147350:1944-2618(+)